MSVGVSVTQAPVNVAVAAAAIAVNVAPPKVAVSLSSGAVAVNIYQPKVGVSVTAGPVAVNITKPVVSVSLANTGPQGANGTNGTNGTNGVGVPTGGTTGQALVKSSATDYATSWEGPFIPIAGGVTVSGAMQWNGAQQFENNTVFYGSINTFKNGAAFGNSFGSAPATIDSAGNFYTDTNIIISGNANLYGNTYFGVSGNTMIDNNGLIWDNLDGNVSVNPWNRLLIDPSYLTSLDWANRLLNDENNAMAATWQANYISANAVNPGPGLWVNALYFPFATQGSSQGQFNFSDGSNTTTYGAIQPQSGDYFFVYSNRGGNVLTLDTSGGGGGLTVTAIHTGAFASSLDNGTITTDGSGNITISGHAYVGGVVTAKSVTIGGTASQFLKADGSVDSSAYITNANVAFLNATQAWAAVQTFGNNINFGGKQLNVSSLASGDNLQYNGTNWINKPSYYSQIQKGTVGMTISGAGVSVVSVSFSPVFSATPVVVATIDSAINGGASPYMGIAYYYNLFLYTYSRSTSGFKLGCNQNGSITTGIGFNISWVAIV